jgi:hypothetical protein
MLLHFLLLMLVFQKHIQHQGIFDQIYSNIILTLIPQNRSHVNGFENTINTLFILLLILLTK